ncbi:DUF4176 domain-containing protein [Lactococcus nasutitermitis]|uniref:DUF4176 domain-containing protein n=1 Tax=Lactococcus nasutitermitis TaxID=1652957 RepID=A0ABV9JBG5_9LACT|nr:DUF4176 domain-containing protein [Lactococcus nasutitermitis]
MNNDEQNKGFLPLGSVVLLNDGEKRLMIVGRKQLSTKSKKKFNYAGVLFPEGYQNAEELYLFNNGDIEHVFQMGLIDDEELAFQNWLVEDNQ